MDDLIEHVVQLLDEYGVQAEIGGASEAYSATPLPTIVLRHGASAQEYALLARPRVGLADIGATVTDLPIFAAASSISPKTAEAFRRAGIQYADAAGNAWVRFGGVLVDVRGRRRPDNRGPRRGMTNGNLFSTARAQVAFALLAWPTLWNAPQRELARVARVSLGQANNALALLRESGFGPEPSGRGAELLHLWAAAFARGLAQKLLIATYQGPADSIRTVHSRDDVFVSGDLAARELLRPASITVYVEQFDPRLAIVNRWRSDGPPNIILRRKFWTTPAHARDDQSGAPNAARTAPWPLVYADLFSSDDPRVRAAAEDWKEQFARPEYDA